MLDRSVLGNVLRTKGTDGFSSVLCWVVVVGDLVCGSSGKSTEKRRGIGSDRGSNTVICGDGVGNSLNNRDCRCSNSFVGADRYCLDNGSNSSNSVVGGDRADGRANNRGNIAVGVWEGVVDKSWVSLSISFTLGNEVTCAICVIGVSSICGVGVSTVGTIRVSPIGGVGTISTSTIDRVSRISIGFRLSHSSSSESENYKL